jgi:hypothetical protein
VSFAAITLYVASQLVFIVSYFFIDSVWKLLNTPSHNSKNEVNLAPKPSVCVCCPSIFVFHWNIPNILHTSFKYLELQKGTTFMSQITDDTYSLATRFLNTIKMLAFCTESYLFISVKSFYVRKLGAGVGESVQTLGYGLEDRGSISESGNDGGFLLATASRQALGLNQTPIQ